MDENGKNLLLVLDNLDRTSPEEALSILSTLQTFLQCETKIDDKKMKKLWIIIPFDRAGLEKIWPNMPRGKGMGGNEKLDAEPKGARQEQPGMASSMIDKRFQVIFRVPPLVLSNWEEYFQQQLADALPNHDRNDRYALYRVFYSHMMLDGQKKTPTPREIKLFINQVGTLHRQWGDQLPLVQMAYFVSLTKRNVDIHAGLVSGAIPEGEMVDILGKNVPENIAALLFNVEPEKAVQLLLDKPIQDAILQGNFSQLDQLSLNYKPNFGVVFDKLPYSSWIRTNPIGIANTAYYFEN